MSCIPTPKRSSALALKIVGNAAKASGKSAGLAAAFSSRRRTSCSLLPFTSSNAGVSAYTLMKLLGHESMVTSQPYVTAAGTETPTATAQNRLYDLLYLRKGRETCFGRTLAHCTVERRVRGYYGRRYEQVTLVP
jgi:hypothetical protein